MRRLIGLFLTFALLTLVPLAPAAARDNRLVVEVHGVESPVGITPDGAVITAGTFYLTVDGTVVETGTIEGVYYDLGTGVHGTRRFVDASSGNVVHTQAKGYVMSIREEPGSLVVAYSVQESIVSSDDGATGRGRGGSVSTIDDDGTFVLESWVTFIINLPS